MERKDLKNKYNEYYKEFKKKEWYQLSQFDKLFILLLDIAKNTTNTNTTNTTNLIESKTLKIEFKDGYCSNNFTLPSTSTLLINPKLDKDITINLQIAYNDKFIDTNLFIDIPKDTQLVNNCFSDYSALINRKDSCRLCSNELITATFLMYYI